MKKIICNNLYRSCLKTNCFDECQKIESEHPYCEFKNLCKLDNSLCDISKDNCINPIKTQKYNILVLHSEDSYFIENPTVYYQEQIIPHVYDIDEIIYALFIINEDIKIHASLESVDQPNRSVWNTFYFSKTKTKKDMLKELVDYELIRLNENIKYLNKSIDVNKNSINFYQNLLKD